MSAPQFNAGPSSLRLTRSPSTSPRSEQRAGSDSAARLPLDIVGFAWVLAGLAVLSVFTGAVMAGVLRLLSMATSIL